MFHFMKTIGNIITTLFWKFNHWLVTDRSLDIEFRRDPRAMHKPTVNKQALRGNYNASRDIVKASWEDAQQLSSTDRFTLFNTFRNANYISGGFGKNYPDARQDTCHPQDKRSVCWGPTVH